MTGNTVGMKTTGKIHQIEVTSDYIIFMFPNEKGIILGKSNSCRLTTNLLSLPAFCRYD
jgi:hypothetical protein